MKKAILKEPRILLLAIAAVMFVITSLSSCASSRSHYQVKHGKITKENKTPECIAAW
tara:strand:- start:1046 stop:1216 length:171 start_codon:yes stop_codon:yes gene_type:complete